MRTTILVACAALALGGCKKKSPPEHEKKGSAEDNRVAKPEAVQRKHDVIPRKDFNRWAVRLNLPVYWIGDLVKDANLDTNEVASLLFYPSSGTAESVWVNNGQFTPAFEKVYDQVVDAAKSRGPDPAGGPEGKRLALVGADLDAGRPTLVRSDFTQLSPADQGFVAHMLKVADLVDKLYATQNGTAALPAPSDPASASLFRRNHGPKCVGPQTESDPACNAYATPPVVTVAVYPAALQADPKYCAALESRPDAKELLGPFTVVSRDFKAVPYSEAFAAQMKPIADELNAAALAMTDPAEAPLVAYLKAAAVSFTTNDWQPADEAWAKMTVDNSKWYVRVAPDEVYWEPCAHKAAFHLTFARINQGSKEWQGKLVPVQQDMEAAVAAHAGAPYTTRKVTFHLPDFIDVVVNAGDDRNPLGATVGESLPNWGPVANEGRGRTVAMVNFGSDADSRRARKEQAESLLDATSMGWYSGEQEAGLLVTILHEASHNLGPSHEYQVGGKPDTAIFGGPVAAVMEELKAQTGGLFLLEFLRNKHVITDEQAEHAYADAIVWAFGQISQGMYTGDHTRKTYGNVAAIQIGILMDQGALTWDAGAAAANGTDKGAFTIHPDKIVGAIDVMLKTVAGIKARGDAAGAQALLAKYVDGPAVPLGLIAERFLRFPKASFVYAVVE
ncbi:MAG TPA: hypothetical protein VGM88_17320 [Kofleriaceae bacterium]|jgi:hypothetical protein